MFWLLACLVPAYTPRVFGDWPNGKSYPITAAQLLPILTGFLAPIHFFQARKELGPRTSGLRFERQDFNQSTNQFRAMPSADSKLNLLVTGGAGFIGSNLTLALQEKFPSARLTMIDGFRSGNFKNLVGFRGDFIAKDLATVDWQEQFGNGSFDAVFYRASITDTTLHDQFIQVHDNVESFRRLLNFARPTRNRIVYASSASTY